MRFILLFLVAIAFQGCFLFTKPPGPNPPPVEEKVTFVDLPERFPIKPGIVNEASGIVASRRIPNTLWIHNDGIGDQNIYLFSTSGEYLGSYNLPFPNRDWEDIGIGPGPNAGRNYMYIGDFGDNAKNTGQYQIYRFLEPGSLQERVGEPAVLQYTYSDGKSHDAECLLVDPKTGDLYIVTKAESLLNELVFKMPFPQSTERENVAQLLGTIPLGLISGGDISADGKEILLKSMFTIHYWKLKENEGIYEAIKRSRDTSPPYQREPQGEAITFSLDQKGFYTISEKPDGVSSVTLNFHAKLQSNTQ